ncbi:hypothetical protein IV102_05945 [bacterium]|nr:hypothetical protein [bacterium]
MKISLHPSIQLQLAPEPGRLQAGPGENPWQMEAAQWKREKRFENPKD